MDNSGPTFPITADVYIGREGMSYRDYIIAGLIFSENTRIVSMREEYTDLWMARINRIADTVIENRKRK